MKKTEQVAIPEVVAEARKHKWKRLKQKIWEYRLIYLMMLPVVILYLVFSYYPMYGILIAWKDYMPSKGVFGSKWAGWKYFDQLFTTTGSKLGGMSFWLAVKNTLVISLLKICFMFPAPIVVALLMNECKAEGYKKGIQTVIYLPNFLSWVIIGAIVTDIFGNEGMINGIRLAFDDSVKPKDFKADPDLYYFILISVSIIKETGWNTIIYMAGITAVSPTLYEAGTIDGCGRFRLMWNVTIPCIMPVIILQFLLAVGNILNAGFDAVYNTYSETSDNLAVSDIIDTYVYRLSLRKGTQRSLGTAAGLVKSVVNFALLMTANTVVKKINGQGIYDLGD